MSRVSHQGKDAIVVTLEGWDGGDPDDGLTTLAFPIQLDPLIHINKVLANP